MTRLTKGQAVAAIQTADSKEAMQAVLMQCTKSVMIEVYEAVTGIAESFKASLKKAELAEKVACRIQTWREDAACYLMEHAELEESLLTDEERRYNEQAIAEAHARVELAAEHEEDAAIWSRQELESIAEELGLEDFDWMSNSELVASIVMKDACMYDGLLAEKEHIMLEERLSAEAQAEALVKPKRVSPFRYNYKKPYSRYVKTSERIRR